MHNISEQLDRDLLRSVALQAAGRQTGVVSTWDVQPIDYPNVSPTSRRLYRIRGTGHDQDRAYTWSLVLKVFVRPPADRACDIAHPLYWKREALAYQTGLLQTLPPTFAAPRYYGVTERPNGDVWLWIEDVEEASGARWMLDRYALVARHLGHLAGPYLAGEPTPQEPWLTRGYARCVVADAAPLNCGRK